MIFFARYEASQFGSDMIETQHLLLGLMREDPYIINRFSFSHRLSESIRNEIERRIVVDKKSSVSVDLPLSDECKRILEYSTEEAEAVTHRDIGTEHLLLGIMREETGIAAQILAELGLKTDVVRQYLTVQR